ncbi:RidA family protein [Sphingomicrobium lutaoense]|uniref:Enamine deaminase RidA (YjgF/YER057c/UK114 family) n=1 Tax=Sphingomicrobium lutaoense TaxID=515949 RepID=A0A839Z0A0_9SPHN|nr:RidA family protein [Sphingomicrobium lutaoense]MBB3763063.1 enamine deaminase RidA (YjgF/YER057c/UK114 family) [Sphingomicrobium lutaoense]
MKRLQPPGWPRPKGYSNGISASGRLVFTAGVIGWNEQEQFEAHGLTGQFEQTLKNILAILAEDGAGPEHIVRMTAYVTDRDAYLAEAAQIGWVWKEVIGKHYPAMALVEVSRLVEEQALVEIEATAVVPE